MEASNVLYCGASADDEYIWLKDYLQADGLVFKFVPIKTPLNGASLFDMGRLDTEMNYNYWKNVDWKNINDGKIYIDVETRKNAVSLRNNMMRLVDVLMREGDTIKAEEILDLSLEKLPIDGFLHYGMTLGMPDAYYRMGKIEKARKLNDQLAEKFTQNLRYYSTFDEQLINVVFDEIETNLLMYNQLIQTALVFDTEEYATSAREKYKEHLDLFNNFLSE